MSILRSLKAHIGTIARFFLLYHLCTAWLCEGETLVNKRIFRFFSLPWGAWTALSPKPRGTQGRSCQRQATAPQAISGTEWARRMADSTEAGQMPHTVPSWRGPVAPLNEPYGPAKGLLNGFSNDHFLLKSAFPLSSSSAAYIHPEGLRFQRRTKE